MLRVMYRDPVCGLPEAIENRVAALRAGKERVPEDGGRTGGRKSILSAIHSRWCRALSSVYYRLHLEHRFAHTGSRPLVFGPRNVTVYGPNISLGAGVIIVGSRGSNTALTTVRMNGHEGAITVGDDVLIMNGVRISSACRIVIEDGCMLANFCYLTDADWHGLHDRTASPGKCAPILLKRGAWIGDSAIVCKGVTIGENSVIGAGAVVTRDVPPNVVAAGNPARVVKKLDPSKIRLNGHDRKRPADPGGA